MSNDVKTHKNYEALLKRKGGMKNEGNDDYIQKS